MSKNEKNSLIGGESISPYSNTSGKQNQGFSKFNGYSINTGLDYLTLNIPVISKSEMYKVNDIKKILKIDNLDYDIITSRNKSSNKIICERHKYDESTNIFINDSVSLGRDLTRIELKGQGCRGIEERYGDDWQTGYYDLMYYAISNGGWATRIDIFIDIFNGDITTKEIDEKIKNCEYTCTPRKYREDGTKNCDDGSNDGWGYLFGQEGSGTRVRIYDKLAEQEARGKSIDVNIKSWIRFEIRFNHDVAKTMLLEVMKNLNNLQNFSLGVLKGTFEFKEFSLDTNKGRWPTWFKWEKFLNDIEKVKPYNQFERESNIQVSKCWYGRSATKIHEIDRLTCSNEEFYISELINRKKGLMKIIDSKATLNDINKERNKKGLNMLCMDDIQKTLDSVNFELESYGFIDEVQKKFSNDVYDDVAEIIK